MKMGESISKDVIVGREVRPGQAGVIRIAFSTSSSNIFFVTLSIKLIGGKMYTLWGQWKVKASENRENGSK